MSLSLFIENLRINGLVYWHGFDEIQKQGAPLTKGCNGTGIYSNLKDHCFLREESNLNCQSDNSRSPQN